MIITTTFTREGDGADGLAPECTVQKASDGAILSKGTMTGIGEGGYSYTFDEAKYVGIVRIVCKVADDTVDSPLTTTTDEIKPKPKKKGVPPQLIQMHPGKPEKKEEDPEEEEEEEPKEKGKKPPFPPKKKDSFNPEFSKRVSTRIRKYKDDGMDDDMATSRAWAEVKAEMLRGDSVARMTREGKYPYYREGKIVEVVKDFPELKKAVDALGGRPLPSYPHHEDADDLARCTGLYYNIVADETTKSVLGETFPDHEKGTMNSIGFWCDEVLGTDGLLHQVNIDLDHVAVSADLIGRGGETVAVIDMADPEMKKQLDDSIAAVKAKGDEITALNDKIKAFDALNKSKDAEIELLKAKSASVGDEIKQLKERLDAINRVSEQKEKSEVIASILDPRRRLGDERTKVLKTKLEGLDLASVKAQKENADIYAPLRADDAVDEHGIFPMNATPAQSDKFTDKRTVYKGSVN